MTTAESRRWQRFLWNAVRYSLGPIGGLVVPWSVVRQATFALWGEALTALIVVQLALHLAQFGSKDLLVREFGRSGSPDALVWASMRARLPLLLPGIIAIFFTVQTSAWLVALWLLLAFIASLNEPLVIHRKRFAAAMWVEVVALILQLSVLVFLRLDLRTIFLSFVVAQASRAIGLCAISGLMRNGIPLGEYSTGHLRMAIPFFLSGFSGLLASRIDLYTVNAMLERDDAGRYQLVASLFLQIQALSMLITTPMTRDLLRTRTTSVQKLAWKIAQVALFLLPLFCAVTWALFHFGFAFEPHWSVYAVGCALIWPAFAYVPLIPSLYRHDKEQQVMWANLGAAGLSAVCTAALLPLVGITGGLIGAACGQWLMLVVVQRSFNNVHALSSL